MAVHPVEVPEEKQTVGATQTIRFAPRGESASEQIGGLLNQYAPLAYMLPWEILDYVELLSVFNADYCVDEDTQILTQRGWLSHQDLRVGDEALSINPATGLASWQVVNAVHRFPIRDRKMIRMESQTHSSLTTPNHRWLVRDYAKRLRWRTSETLKTGDSVPLSASVEGLPSVQKYDDAFVELVAWFYTEGSWDEERFWHGQITQSRIKNPENVDRIRACLWALYGPPRKLSPGGRTKENKGLATWSETDLRDLAAFNLTKAILQDLAVVVLPGKVPSAEFLCSLTRAQLALFIQTSIYGDGWHSCGGLHFAQNDQRRSDAFQMACVLAGYAISTHEYSNGQIKTSLLKRHHIWPRNWNGLAQRAVYETAKHTGMVWCPSLDYQNWVARRNGSVFFTGNSQAVENVRSLANSGHDLIIEASPRAARRIKSRLEEKSRTIQEQHGGIDGLIDKLLDQAVTYGAIACEWTVSDDLTDVVDCVDINPKSIRFFWDQVLQKWAPFQKVSMDQAREAEDAGQEVRNGIYVRLNDLTFRYRSFDAAPSSPYGVPPFLAALANIAIQRDMVNNMAQIVKKIGLLGIIDMTVKGLPRKQGESEETYTARATSFLNKYVEVIQNMVRDGGLVHFDDIETKTYQVTGNAAGATNIFKVNEELIFSGLKAQPSLHGRCVVPSTKVLTADYQWVEAGKLALGDTLVGFAEDFSVDAFESSVVEHNERIHLWCQRVVTNRGEVIASEKHPFVVLRDDSLTWVMVKDLEEGDKIARLSLDKEDSWASVLWIEDAGVQEVVALQTSTRTFVAEGLLSHNSFSTTETYAGVAYEITLRNTFKYQRAVKRIIESGYWLMANLWGDVPNGIGVHFHSNKSLNRLQEAQAESLELRSVFSKWVMGIIDQLQAAQELGYNQPATPMDDPPPATELRVGRDPKDDSETESLPSED